MYSCSYYYSRKTQIPPTYKYNYQPIQCIQCPFVHQKFWQRLAIFLSIKESTSELQNTVRFKWSPTIGSRLCTALPNSNSVMPAKPFTKIKQKDLCTIIPTYKLPSKGNKDRNKKMTFHIFLNLIYKYSKRRLEDETELKNNSD